MERTTKRTGLLFSLLIAFTTLTNAQHYVLCGTAYQGGVNNYGTIFRYDFQTGKDTAIVIFNNTTNGENPIGTLMQDPNDSLLYGLTTYGGTYGDGVLFSVNAATGKDSTRFQYKELVNGWEPYQGNLTWYNNMFYGLIWGGGPSDSGVIFSFDPTTNHDSTVYNFTKKHNDSYYPWGTQLTPYSNGLMYGMTYGNQYGPIDGGSIFSFDPVTGKDSVIVTLDTATGFYPEEGSLILDKKNQLLYGVNYAGGSADSGTLFNFNPLTGAYNVLLNFNTAIGANPAGSVMYDSVDGKFYGMTLHGGTHQYGVIYSYDPVKNKDSVLYNFDSTHGRYPEGNFVMGPDGLLYGFTTQGGAVDSGVIFNFNPMTGKDSVLASLNVATGGYAFGTPTIVNICPVAKIASQPKTAHICAGSDTSFTLKTQSAKTMSYQWQVNKGTGFNNVSNGGMYSGATTNTLHITKAMSAMNGYKFMVTAMDGCSDLTSDIITLSVDTVIVNVTGKNSVLEGSTDTLVVTGACTYVWSTGATKDTLFVSPLVTTTYSVVGHSCTGGCSSKVDTISVTPIITTGLNNLQNNNIVSAYPNPVAATLYITANTTAAMPATIKITDITGKKVMNFTTSINGAEAIDVHILPEGMYLVKVITEKSTQTIKFIKN